MKFEKEKGSKKNHSEISSFGGWLEHHLLEQRIQNKGAGKSQPKDMLILRHLQAM